MALDFNKKQITPAVTGVLSDQPKSVLQNINGENWETDGGDPASDVVCYFQIFDKATEPVLDDVPLFTWRIPGGGRFNANMPGPSYQQLIGQAFVLGISVGWSLTDATFTPATIGGKWWATGRYAQ